MQLNACCDRGWREIMSTEPADLVLKRRTPGPIMTSSDQVAWLHAMRIPLRSISMDLSFVSGRHTCSDAAASTVLALSADLLATSAPCLQVRSCDASFLHAGF